MLKEGKRSGFTLIELSLTIGFVSVLALTLVYVLINMMNTYQRGLTLKQVNTTGSNIIDEFRGAIADSSAKSIVELCDTIYTDNANRTSCKNDGAYSFVYLVRVANVVVSGKQKTNVPVYGAFCSGVYSYIWNSGYLFDSKVGKSVNPATFNFRYDDDDTIKNMTMGNAYRLLKITDPDRSVCVSKVLQHTNGNYATTTSLASSMSDEFDITKDDYGTSYAAIRDIPLDLISTSDVVDSSYGSNSLALYDLSIYRPAQDSTTRNIFYSGSFTLATIEGGVDIKASGDYCATPTDYLNENFNYCAINKFNFATQANGE